jgi:hypothetical protein
MPATITTNVNLVGQKIDDLPRKLEDELGDLVKIVTVILAQVSAQNVRQGGGKFGRPWLARSKWITAKKGAGYNLFEGQDRRIRAYGVSKLIGNVAFFSPGEWTLTQHQEGFTIPASGEDVTITNLKAPGALGLPVGQSSYRFKWRNDSKVPARQMWPTEPQAYQIAGQEVSKWVRFVADRMIQ